MKQEIKVVDTTRCSEVNNILEEIKKRGYVTEEDVQAMSTDHNIMKWMSSAMGAKYSQYSRDRIKVALSKRVITPVMFEEIIVKGMKNPDKPIILNSRLKYCEAIRKANEGYWRTRKKPMNENILPPVDISKHADILPITPTLPIFNDQPILDSRFLPKLFCFIYAKIKDGAEYVFFHDSSDFLTQYRFAINLNSFEVLKDSVLCSFDDVDIIRMASEDEKEILLDAVLEKANMTIDDDGKRWVVADFINIKIPDGMKIVKNKYHRGIMFNERKQVLFENNGVYNISESMGWEILEPVRMKPIKRDDISVGDICFRSNIEGFNTSLPMQYGVMLKGDKVAFVNDMNVGVTDKESKFYYRILF